jgi:transposase
MTKTTKTPKTNKKSTAHVPQSVKNKADKTNDERRYDPAIWEMINPHAAGIDVHSEEMWVCVPSGHAGHAERTVRKFGAYTDDLYAIADFLTTHEVTSVAMESTGVYWIPLYQILEARGFSVCLTNARHLKSIAGRPKTDKRDCQWIQRLHSYGFLNASFRPDETICQIRAIQRHRSGLIQQASRHIQHMQKALDQMNLKLSKVLTDITGASGMAIIDHILAGERNPKKLATFRDHRCQKSEAEIAKALTGDYREEHLFVLAQALESYRFVQRQRQACDRAIEARLQAMDKQVDANQTPPSPCPKTSRAKRTNEMQFTGDGRTLLYELFGTDVTAIPGLDVTSGCVLYSELGADLSAWSTDKKFVSWLALSPAERSSAGRITSNKTKKTTHRASQVFQLAAQSVSRSNTALGAFYRRLKARIGAPKALTATARKIALIFYQMVTKREPYRELSDTAYRQQQNARRVTQLKRWANELGYVLTPQEA